jgi:septation ring formation regulator EzrA
MANKEELSFTLRFVTPDDKVVYKTATTLKEINQSIKDMSEQLDNTDLGSDTWKEYNKDLDNAKKALDQVEQSQMSLGEKLSAIPGPVGAAVQSLRGIGTAF